MAWFLNRRGQRRERVRISPYERQPAPAFLFEPRRLSHRGEQESDPERPRAILRAANQPPHHVTRREQCIVRRREAANVTVTSTPGNSIVVIGGGAEDWSVFFSVSGFGRTAAEAEHASRLLSLEVGGTTIAVHGPDLYDRPYETTGELVVEAPSGSGVLIHGSFAPAEVRDMHGPVRIAAAHARATVLGTTGLVDVTAGCVDFAGAGGQVTLTAEAEINLKVNGARFDGALLAWAQRPVRLLIPPGFDTPLEAAASARDRFVCRADIRRAMAYARHGGLHRFTYGDVSGSPSACIRLRSEHSTVVIDETTVRS